MVINSYIFKRICDKKKGKERKSLKNNFLSDTVYVLLTGSENDNQKMEVIYANGTTKICKDKFKYPLNIYYATGLMLKWFFGLMICGGEPPVNSACYVKGLNDQEWVLFANMTIPRTASASVITKNHIWITGNSREV